MKNEARGQPPLSVVTTDTKQRKGSIIQRLNSNYALRVQCDADRHVTRSLWVVSYTEHSHREMSTRFVVARHFRQLRHRFNKPGYRARMGLAMNGFSNYYLAPPVIFLVARILLPACWPGRCDPVEMLWGVISRAMLGF